MFTQSKYIIGFNSFSLEIIEDRNSEIYDKAYIITHNVDVSKTKPFVDLIKDKISRTIQEVCFLYEKNSIYFIRYVKDIFLYNNNLAIQISINKTSNIEKNSDDYIIKNHNLCDWFIQIQDYSTKNKISSKDIL